MQKLALGLILCLFLGACGSKGPLTLPQPAKGDDSKAAGQK